MINDRSIENLNTRKVNPNFLFFQKNRTVYLKAEEKKSGSHKIYQTDMNITRKADTKQKNGGIFLLAGHSILYLSQTLKKRTI